MQIRRLRIDTSVTAVAGPPSARNVARDRAVTPSSAQIPPSSTRRRPRGLSTSSTSSSISVLSPTSSSPSSVHFQHEQVAPVASVRPSSYSPDSPVSPTLDETMRLTSEYVLAMHDFSAEQENATCLSFRAGQVIHVLNRDSSGWWDGELEGRRGWFPSNYVNADVDVTSLIEEELPRVSRRRRHSHSKSTISTTSWIGVSSDEESLDDHNDRRRDPSAGSLEIESYCPPIMIPLLHTLSLLQGAVEAHRVSQFQPSSACMIACVRSILSSTGCLPRDALLLQRFPHLAQERKRILSVLASLVSQSKRASEDMSDRDEEKVEFELDELMRLGGQVFAHVKRFLALALHYGVEFPDQHPDASSAFGSPQSEDLAFIQSKLDPPADRDIKRIDAPQLTSVSDSPVLDRAVSQQSKVAPRAKSMFDLREKRELVVEHTPSRPIRVLPGAKRQLVHRPALPSFSSTSSSSSLSSNVSSNTPCIPSGPVNTIQVMDALRHTHDQYLSTIAAFIGHAHSHSRTSHASSTGHMYDLVREVVEMVCKLLTIVEAVMRHPDIPSRKVGDLRSAKEGLYTVTNSLAESVRLLTVSLPPTVTEEEEKANLLRCATSALKASADCVAAVKTCLVGSAGYRALIIHLPVSGDDGPEPFATSSFSASLLRRSSSITEFTVPQSADGTSPKDADMTIRARTLSSPRPIKSSKDGAVGEIRSRDAPESSEGIQSEAGNGPSGHNTDVQSLEAEVTSPQLLSPISDESAWEGQVPVAPGEEILNGGPPSVPTDPVPEGRPDPIAWALSHDYTPSDVAYNSEGHLVGATIEVLVTKMTPHDSIVDPAFASVFFLTFRLFSSPVELVKAIRARYDLPSPQNATPEDFQLWEQRKRIPLRLRVSNFIKSWLEVYWRPSQDAAALPSLLSFTRDTLALTFSAPSQRILELIQARLGAVDTPVGPKGDRLRDPGMSLSPQTDIPRPVMTKTLLATLRNQNFSAISITDFDALELARQVTIMECTLFRAVQADEILESGQDGVKPPVNVRAVSTLSTTITGWVAESILNELDIKKRQGLVKFFIKVADRCVSLQNYSTPRSILAALDSSTISRLHQTWMGLPQKSRIQLETLRRLADHSRNYHEYRCRLRNTIPPAVPFLGLYLTDVTFCREGNSSHRSSPLQPEKKLINFSKFQKLARIVQDMQRFQCPYNLKKIPEAQEYLKIAFANAKDHGDLQDLYRRSLLVEPRQPADSPPTSDVRQLFNWATRTLPQTATS